MLYFFGFYILILATASYQDRCIGSHDLIKGDYGEQFFESRFGPAWYAFDAGGNLYVITPMMGGDYPPGFDHEDIGGWLQNLLEIYGKDQPKLFFNHDLLSNTSDFIFLISSKVLKPHRYWWVIISYLGLWMMRCMYWKPTQAGWHGKANWVLPF